MNDHPAQLNLKTVNPMTEPDWDERLIRSGENYSFFHSSGWADVLCSAYGYSPCYFASGNGRSFSALVPMMEIKSRLTQHRGVSLPFSDYCDSILADPSSWEPIRAQIIEYGRNAGWRYVEFRGAEENISGPLFSYYYSHKLDLRQKPEILFSGLDGAVRRNIKKARKERVETGIYRTASAVREFYKLNCMTRKEHGLPPQPYNFFQEVYRRIIVKDKGFVMLSSYRDRPVAGAVFLHIGDKMLFKYGASDRKWQHLRANNLLMWEAIQWAQHSGFHTFCFGRTEPDNIGLRRFKAGWGAREGLIKYYRYDLEADHYVRMPESRKTMHRIFRKLPIPVLHLIGHVFYRHMG